MMYVGDRADGGILGQMFTLVDEIKVGYISKQTLTLQDAFLDYKTWALAKLGEISSNTYWSLRKLEDWSSGMLEFPGTLREIRDSSSAPHTINVTINGAVQDPRRLLSK